MTERISREQMLMEIAFTVAKRGTCKRLQVGAVIAKDSRPISIGYAGAEAGAPHCSPDVCDASMACIRTIHAEQNAITFAARHGIPISGAELFTTDSPCNVCAGIIINAGIKSVFYSREYRDTSGLQRLAKSGIEVTRCQL